MSVSSIAAKAQPSFFEVRWEMFEKIELLRGDHDQEHLRSIQRNILDCELPALRPRRSNFYSTWAADDRSWRAARAAPSTIRRTSELS